LSLLINYLFDRADMMKKLPQFIRLRWTSLIVLETGQQAFITPPSSP
jgi:hypothetical protein